MRRFARAAIAALLAGSLGAPAWSGPGASAGAGPGASAVAAGDDVVIDRAFVPSEKRPQGEVRVVRQDGQVVVQTILYTRLLKRVLAGITGKERHNWPAGAAGHQDMERYVAALEAYRKKVAATEDEEADGSGRRKTMIIEFVDDTGGPFVSLGGVDLEGSGAEIRVRRREKPVVLGLSAAYIRRNMRLIVADTFGVPLEEADRRLKLAGGPGEE